MRKFTYMSRSNNVVYSFFTEEQVIKNAEGGLFPKNLYDLFELVPRTIQTVTKQEIV